MSPAGNQLQNYFRKYPSLVNCTSIDWFLNWPTEALKAVSDHHLLKLHAVIMESTQVISPFHSLTEGEKPKNKGLETIAEGFEGRDGDEGSLIQTDRQKSMRESNVEPPTILSKEDGESGSNNSQSPFHLDEELDPDTAAIAKMTVRERVSQVFTQVHQSSMELADIYFRETKRQVYVTPVMFMDVFDLFGTLLTRKNEENEKERTKYDLGVRKLDEAKVMIIKMEAELTKLQPELVEKTKEVEKTQRKLEKESKEVFAIKEKVDEETAVAETE